MLTVGSPLNAVEAFTALLGGAILVALLARRVAVPYTVGLVLLGLLVAGIGPRDGYEISPDLVLLVLLPGLVFWGAYQTDVTELRSTWAGIAMLAVPGVLISAGLVAAVLHEFAGLPLQLSFVVGAMASATDPVAVLSTFKQIGAPPRLATLVEGESLLNDGTAIVLFAVAVRTVGAPVSLWDATLTFCVTVVASVVIGAATGFAGSRLVVLIDDHLIELMMSVFLAYGTYLAADALDQSGVIATVVAGVTLRTYGRRVGMSVRTREALDTVWEFLAFVLTTLTFVLIGLAISLPSLAGAVLPITWGVLAVLAARVLKTYVLVGGAARLVLRRRRGVARDGLPLGWLHILFWSGLRGAVAVALALSLPTDIPQRALLQEITFGIVLFTLVVQGMSIDALARHVLAGPTSARPAHSVS